MEYAYLNDRAIIALSGEDTITFLQGLITNDADRLSQGDALYAAMLSPQGKFLHDFFLLPTQEHILIDIHADRAEDLYKRLSMYKLRSNVTITRKNDTKVMAIWGGEIPSLPDGDIYFMADPRLPAMGLRIYAAPETLEPLHTGMQQGDYENHRIGLGIPDGAKDMHIDKSLLMEFGFESLHGVSFSKGCYVGQEVTARSKFRGQVRKSLYLVTADTTLPPQGTLIIRDTIQLGELLSVSGQRGLALLRTEELEKTQLPIMANGTALHYHWPAWNKRE